MRAWILAILVAVAAVSMYSVKRSHPYDYLTELNEYEDLSEDGTTAIDVVYYYDEDYDEGFFEFTIEDEDTIDAIIDALFEVELEEYPEDRCIDFLTADITVHQGIQEYDICLNVVVDERGNLYLCKAGEVHDIIEQYIEDNLL